MSIICQHAIDVNTLDIKPQCKEGRGHSFTIASDMSAVCLLERRG